MIRSVVTGRPRPVGPATLSWLARSLRRDVFALVALVVLVIVVAVALLAPYIAPLDPLEQDLANRLLPPGAADANVAHVLGTDRLGRDTLSRVIVASRVSLLVALSVVVITLVIGCFLGIAAGWSGGKVDHLIMSVTDTVIAFPGLLMILSVSAFLGPGLGTIIAALSIRFWTTYARMTRGMVLQLRETDFVTAARALGATEPHSIRTHVIPNMLSPLATLVPLELGRVMLAEAGVSFLGLGVQSPMVSWGLLVADGRQNIQTAWWLITFPGLALFITILSSNMLGSWLRLATDPIHRGRFEA